jgi:hypothetical protein
VRVFAAYTRTSPQPALTPSVLQRIMSEAAARKSRTKVAIPGGKGRIDLPRMDYLKNRSGRDVVAAWRKYPFPFAPLEGSSADI